MIKLIKKYTILIAASVILVAFLTLLIPDIFPNLLTTGITEDTRFTFGTAHLMWTIQYLFNIVFIFVLHKDMKKADIHAVPVLVLTFFSSFVGVLFFFLIIASKTLNYKKLLYE